MIHLTRNISYGLLSPSGGAGGGFLQSYGLLSVRYFCHLCFIKLGAKVQNFFKLGKIKMPFDARKPEIRNISYGLLETGEAIFLISKRLSDKMFL